MQVGDGAGDGDGGGAVALRMGGGGGSRRSGGGIRQFGAFRGLGRSVEKTKAGESGDDIRQI